jgi:hypothetical protein
MTTYLKFGTRPHSSQVVTVLIFSWSYKITLTYLESARVSLTQSLKSNSTLLRNSLEKSLTTTSSNCMSFKNSKKLLQF